MEWTSASKHSKAIWDLPELWPLFGDGFPLAPKWQRPQLSEIPWLGCDASGPARTREFSIAFGTKLRYEDSRQFAVMWDCRWSSILSVCFIYSAMMMK